MSKQSNKQSVEQKQEIIESTVDNGLAVLIKELQLVDIKSPLAKLNETTMSDNNGARIEL